MAPRIVGSIPSNSWEREVLRQMKKQLPDDWTVVPNVHWALLDEARILRDGQCDFVVLVPGAGMVVVEVKGSKEIWVGEDGRWYRLYGGEKSLIDEPPPDQASRNMYDLERIISEKGGWPSLPGRYSWIVAYPNGEASNVPAMFDGSTLITRKYMHELTPLIRKALALRAKGSRGDLFTSEVVAKIARILTSQPFSVKEVDTSLAVSSDHERVDELTRQQFAALRGVFDLPRVAVNGPAGSGKTWLATSLLRSLVDAEKRALFVCYNKDLAEFLRAKNPDCRESIIHVDGFFRRLWSRPWPDRADSDFFQKTLADNAFDQAALLTAGQKYDAIIVDEGQDFSSNQIVALLEFLREDGRWTLFADWNQDLYRRSPEHTIGAEVVFNLSHNCRNTEKINAATNAYLNFDVKSMPGVPQGVNPLVELCATTQAMVTRAWELALQWRGDGSVAILSPYRLSNSSMCDKTEHQRCRLVDDVEDFSKPDTVYFSTIKSFKGLEAAAVIVVDIPLRPSTGFADEDLYVACTRATSRLALLSTDSEAIQSLTVPDR